MMSSVVYMRESKYASWAGEYDGICTLSNKKLRNLRGRKEV